MENLETEAAEDNKEETVIEESAAVVNTEPEEVEKDDVEDFKRKLGDSIDETCLGHDETKNTENNTSDNTSEPSCKEDVEPMDNEEDNPVLECKDNEKPANITATQYPKSGEPGFSTEYFKIEIKNLPRNVSHSQLKKLLIQLSLKPRKIKIMSYSRYAYVTFGSEEDKVQAMKVLQSYVYRNFKLIVKHAKPLADPCKASPKGRNGSNRNQSEQPSDMTQEPLTSEERIQNAVTPLWKKPYEVQIATKFRNIVELLKRMTKQLMHVQNIGPWVKNQSQENNGKCCVLRDVVQSPVLTGYRNKSEFNVGRGPEGEEKTVGFRVSSYKKGDCTVIEPDVCLNVSQRMKDVVKSFQTYVQSSDLPALDAVTHKGHWQQIMIRTCQSGDVMGVVQFYPQNLPQSTIDEEKKKIADYYTTGGGASLKMKSLYFQANNVLNPGGHTTAPCECIAGEENLFEEMNGLKFRISPSSFFQVNTKAAELLYSKIKDLCEVTPQTTFIDICCGIGTIGLTMAKDCQSVIGVDSVPQAIQDAEFNAQFNGVTNTQYICGKAEDILPKLVNECLKDEKHIVGVVDPPRAGLHHLVVRALRSCTNLKTLIYVSCSPNNAYNNFIDLCRPASKRTKGDGFRLVQAIPVDLFPYTPHCELILQFVRE